MSLRLDFCSASAARYACEHWHYSRSVPFGKSVKIGVWEDGKFIGVIIYAQGANYNIAKPFAMKQEQVVELCRVALKEHKAPVSRIVAISLRLLKKVCPGIELVVSYADADQGHYGGIYQAGNWIFVGKSEGLKTFLVNNKKIHPRMIRDIYGTNSVDRIKQLGSSVEVIQSRGKYKYVMPLTANSRTQIERIALEYPKRAPVVQE